MRRSVAAPGLARSRYRSADTSPGYLFWKAFHAWQRTIRDRLAPLGISQAQYSVLATLSYLASATDTVRQQDIANALSMDKMMVSDVVKSLEARALVTRRRSASDARSFVVQMTPRAASLLRRATPTVEGVDERFFGVLAPRARQSFLAALRRLDTP